MFDNNKFDIKDIPINFGYLIKGMLLNVLTVSHMGFILSTTNACITSLRVQLDWGDQEAFYITMVTSSQMVGITIGCVFAGPIV